MKLLGFFLLALVATATALPLIIDTDADVDDMAAIWYALSFPNSDVRLITVAGNSWAHLGAGMTNVYNLLSLLGRDDVAVAPGANYAWRDAANHTHRQSDAIPDGGKGAGGWGAGDGRYEVDILYGSARDLPVSRRQWGPADPEAVEAIRRLMVSIPGNVTWLALGGFSVFGQYLKTFPQDISRIDRCYAMGGAVNRPGNLFTVPTNPTAEFNVYVDPDAASYVVRSGVPVYLMALDVTHSVPYTPNIWAKLTDPAVTPSWLATVMRRMRASSSSSTLEASFFTIFYPWDEFTTAVALDPAVFAATHFTPRRITVVTTEGSELGRTKEDNATGSWVYVGDATNPSVYWASWFRIVGPTQSVDVANDGDGTSSKWNTALWIVVVVLIVIATIIGAFLVWKRSKQGESKPTSYEKQPEAVVPHTVP